MALLICGKQSSIARYAVRPKNKNSNVRIKLPSVEESDEGLSEARSAWMANKVAGMRFNCSDDEIIEIFRKMQKEKKIDWERREAEGSV